MRNDIDAVKLLVSDNLFTFEEKNSNVTTYVLQF